MRLPTCDDALIRYTVQFSDGFAGIFTAMVVGDFGTAAGLEPAATNSRHERALQRCPNRPR